MQTNRIAILLVFLALAAAACQLSGAPKAAAFATPEEAITAYFEGVAQGDTAKILQACAITEMSEKFRFDLYTNRLKALLPMQSLAPADQPLYVEANKAQLSSQILGRVKIFAYSLLSDENVADGTTILIDEARTEQFMKDVDLKKLAGIEVKKIALPDKTLMNDARYQENAAKIAEIYGADESTERVALFAFEQNDYFLGFSLLRYGETWKISSQTSPLAGTSALGSPQLTTEEEFDDMINK